MASLYDRDIVLWSQEQSAALRRAAVARPNLPIDWENVAEEIESLGRSERRELRSQIRRVIEHFMLLEASPARDPRRGWIDSVFDAQREIEDRLQTSPSLRREVPAIVAEEIIPTRRYVRDKIARYDETPVVDPVTLSYTEEQALGWCPDL